MVDLKSAISHILGKEGFMEEEKQGFSKCTIVDGEVICLADGRYVTVPHDKKKKVWKWVKAILMTFVAALCCGTASYFFITPNGFAVGGIMGIGMMIDYTTGINQGWFYALMNLPLLIFAFIILSKKFSILTLLFILLNSATTLICEVIDKAIGGKLIYADTQPAIISAVFGGVMFGVSLAIMLKVGGAMGGTDVIASMVLKKRPDLSVSRWVFVADSLVVVASFFVYKHGLTPILLSIIQAFTSSMVTDTLLKGSKSALKAEIITTYADEISAEIMKKIVRGVTVVDAVGMYTGTERKLLVTVIKRRQLGELQEIIRKYPDTFSYIVPANEVYGMWRK